MQGAAAEHISLPLTDVFHTSFLMAPLASFRIFADHYQFFVHDGAAEACPEYFYDRKVSKPPELIGDDAGYITDGRSICFGTSADLNRRWIEVYRSDLPLDTREAQRPIALLLNVDSGKVSVSTLIDLNTPDVTVEVPPGRYTVYLLGFDLDKDPGEEADDRDAPASAWANAERYNIVLVPGEGHIEPYGVVQGAPTLTAVRESARA